MEFEQIDDRDGGSAAPAATECPVVGASAVDVVEGLFDLSDAELDARLRDLELHRRRLDAEFAMTVEAVQRRKLYAADGHRSMKGYLRATCNWSNGDVSVHRRHAAGLAAIPGLGQAWHAGQISRSQVDALCRVWGNTRIRARVVEHAELLIDLAASMVFDDFCKALDTFVLLADPDGAEQHHRDDVDGRDVHVIDANGLLHLAARGGDPIVNGELAGIFQQFCDREFRIDTANRNLDGTLPRTGAQRRYDAFVEVMRRAHTTLAGNAGTGADVCEPSDVSCEAVERGDAAMDPSSPPPVRPGSTARVVLNLLMSEPIMAAALAAMGLAPTDEKGRPLDPFTGAPVTALRNLLDQVARDPDVFAALRCETGTGTVVHPVRLLQAAFAGHMRRVVVDSRGVVLDMGRSRRVFTGAAREAVMLLARRCDHPGCDLPDEWCQADHVTEWTDHGHTDQDNGRPRCGHHNRLKHERAWQVAFDTRGRPHTIRADGTPMTPVGADPPTLAIPPPAPGRTHCGRPLVPDTSPLDDDARQRHAEMHALGWAIFRYRCA